RHLLLLQERDDVLPLPKVPGDPRARSIPSEVEQSFCLLLVMAPETVRLHERRDLLPKEVVTAPVGAHEKEQDERARQRVARESGGHQDCPKTFEQMEPGRLRKETTGPNLGKGASAGRRWG